MNCKKWFISASMFTMSVGLAMAADGAAFQAPKAPPAPPSPPKVHSYSYSVGSNTSASYLGVDITDISSERVSALKLKDEHGVEITMVDRDAPAGKAGLKEHDVIL